MKTGKSTHILFLINNFGLGGAERVFIRDINALSVEGYEVSVAFLYPHRGDAKLLPPMHLDPSRIFSLNFKNLYDIAGYRRLASIVRKSSVDVVYSTLDDANVASRVLRLFVPSVRVYAREANVANNKSIKFKIADILLNFLSTKIVACSPLVGETLVPYQPFHKHKMVVVENGIEIPNEVPSREGRDSVTVLTVGSLDPKKRHIFLLRAVTRLLNADFAWKLFAVGGGPLEQELREFVSTHGLSEHVVLTGTKTKEEVSEYYKAADMFVFVPEWEGGPNVILEAMSYGLPCVSTRRVGEKIEDGVTGFLVDYGDEAALAEKIAEIARDHTLRRSMGVAGRAKLIRENSMEAHLKRLRSVLELN